MEKLDDKIIYVNGEEYAKTKYENYTLSNLKPGNYTVYYTTCNQKSKNVSFRVYQPEEKVTTWDVEMVQARGVTFSALISYKNYSLDYGKV